MTSNKTPNTVRIYACGGAGTNIVGALGEIKERDGYAATKNCYIDTSRSNINARIPEDNIFIVTKNGEELKGSGGVRGSNAEPIVAEVRAAIKQFPPEEYNLIVGSLSGGSGAVILPVLAKELLEAGHNCMCILLGSAESEIRAINTVNTLASLDNIAREHAKRPIVASYVDQARGVLRKKIDDEVTRAIGKALVFLSGGFHGLDNQDVIHFLDYTKITTIGNIEPQLCLLQVAESLEDVKAFNYPVISIGSLYINPDVAPHDIDSRYDCIGYGTLPDMPNQTSVHYLLSADAVSGIYDKLAVRADELTHKVEHNVTRKQISTGNQKPNRSGLVL